VRKVLSKAIDGSAANKTDKATRCQSWHGGVRTDKARIVSDLRYGGNGLGLIKLVRENRQTGHQQSHLAGCAC
jgi:uncharacterized membrane-anchored protein